MFLIVGPAGHRTDLVAAAMKEWQAFESELGGSLPFTCDPIRFDSNSRSMSATAAAFVFAGPRYPTEFALILMSPAFFEELPNRRFLTLLHESIHLHFMMGPLRQRVIESLELQRVHDVSPDLGPDDWLFSSQRVHLAFSFRNFIDEILAELHLRETYPQHLRDRVLYYLEMRKRSFTLWQKAAVPELRPMAVLHEVLRNELGARLADGEPEAVEFNVIAGELLKTLKDMCAPQDYARHLTTKDQMMSATLDPLTFGAAAFDDAFSATMKITRLSSPDLAAPAS